MSDILMFLDTETTGFAKNGDLKQEGQARVCQIAMLVTDGEGKSIAEYMSLIKPDGWTMQPSAGKIHGFTDTQCEMFGVSARGAFNFFNRMAEFCTTFVAHNWDFDCKMMEIEAAYLGCQMPTGKKSFCTMKQSTNLVKAPQTNGYGYKWPKLEEALKHFTGRTLEGFAHDAMYDVRACRDIFFAMKKREAA